MIQPTIFGKFILLERVSIGGMAEIFRAKLLNNPEFERFFAVKRILPHLAKDDGFVKMFIDEAKVAVDLEHPNVCQIYELGRLGELHYIAMEYIAGRDVEAIQGYYRKQKKIMSVSQACFIVAQGAQGLDYAHKLLLSLNFVHRDVSPQNLLVTYDGVVKLIDFGVAKANSSRKSAKSDSGVVKGKFSYMSPEQAMGLDIDRRSDIFSLGVIFWELLTGRRLFVAENEFAIMDMITECKIEKPSKYNRLIPEKVEQICMKALEKNVNKRYQWASEMVDDLYAFINACKIPFTQWHLQNWMCTAFKEAFEGEWAKVPIFKSLNTEADVERYNKEHAHEFEVGNTTTGAEAGSNSGLSKGISSVSGSKSIPNVKPISLDEKLINVKSTSEEDDNVELEPEGISPTVSDPSVLKFKRAERKAKTRKGLMVIIVAICVCFIASPILILQDVFELPMPEIKSPTSVELRLDVVPESSDVSVKLYPASKGETPLETQTGNSVTFTGLKPDGYILHVDMDGYESEEFSVKFAENGIYSTRLELGRPIPQRVEYEVVVTPEDANLYANGEKVSRVGSAYRIEGIDGENYRLEVRRSGYEPVVKTGVFDDDTENVKIALNKSVDVGFRLSSEPQKSQVYFIVDGKAVKQGDTPLSIDRIDNTTPLQIEVRHNGYETWTRTIDFSKDDQNMIRLFANLETN